MEIIRIYEPEVFQYLGDLFERAFTDSPRPEQAAAWCRAFVSSDAVRIWTTSEVSGLAIVERGDEVFAPPATIAHFYSEDSETRHLLCTEICRWMEEEDLEEIVAWNQTGRSDEAHIRLFRRYLKGRKSGGVIRYERVEQCLAS